MDVVIFPSSFYGTIALPPSKSQTLRAIFFSAFAQSASTIVNPLGAKDSEAMRNSLTKIGAHFDLSENRIETMPISAAHFHQPTPTIDVGQSGLTFRLMTAIAALFPEGLHIEGDHSLCLQRPITDLTNSLKQLGARVVFSSPGQNAPLFVSGPLLTKSCSIHSIDSQPITALFYLGLISKEHFSVFYTGCEEKPWLDLSFAWSRFLNIPAEKTDNRFTVFPNSGYPGFVYRVPGDLSAMAFFIVLSVIHQIPIRLESVDLTDPQPDKSLLTLLDELGVPYFYQSENFTLDIQPEFIPIGFHFDLEKGIDLLPILAVLACFLKTPSFLFNGKIARKKECDRIRAMALELRKMGALLIEHEDGLQIFPSQLKGAILNSHQDHRIAMSLSIAATLADSPSTLLNANCVEKTFPHFFTVLSKLGIPIENPTASKK